MKDDAAHELRKTDADRAAEVLARNAVDRAQLQARLGPQLSWHHEYNRRKLRRHGWRLDKTADGVTTTVAVGRNFTKGGADRAWYRAYLTELNS